MKNKIKRFMRFIDNYQGFLLGWLAIVCIFAGVEGYIIGWIGLIFVLLLIMNIFYKIGERRYF